MNAGLVEHFQRPDMGKPSGGSSAERHGQTRMHGCRGTPVADSMGWCMQRWQARHAATACQQNGQAQPPCPAPPPERDTVQQGQAVCKTETKEHDKNSNENENDSGNEVAGYGTPGQEGPHRDQKRDGGILSRHHVASRWTAASDWQRLQPHSSPAA